MLFVFSVKASVPSPVTPHIKATDGSADHHDNKDPSGLICEDVFGKLYSIFVAFILWRLECYLLCLLLVIQITCTIKGHFVHCYNQAQCNATLKYYKNSENTVAVWNVDIVVTHNSFCLYTLANPVT